MAEAIKTKLEGGFMLSGTVTISTTATVVTGLNRVLCVQVTAAEAIAETDAGFYATVEGGTVTIGGADKSVYYTIIGI